MSISYRRATHPDDIAACLTLRETVFIVEQGVAADLERDGEDATCIHVIAVEGYQPVGAARYQYPADYAKLQRVCVPAEARGRGIGAGLIRFMLDEVRRDGKVARVRLGAQTHALEFYEKLGFVAFGPEYLDAGIPHRDMEILLDRS